jgi:hypothetical protein
MCNTVRCACFAQLCTLLQLLLLQLLWQTIATGWLEKQRERGD